MADFGGSLFAPGGIGQTNYQTSFLDPQLVQKLAQTLAGVQQGAAGQYLNFLQNPTASPLFQGQLSGLLNSLVPSEQRAATNLSDMFRAAGNTASSTFGGAAQGLQSDILRNRQTLASQLLGQAFPQIVQALQQPMSQADDLIRSLRTAQGSSAGGGGTRVVPFGGGGTPFLDQPFSDPYAALGITRNQYNDPFFSSNQPYETAFGGGIGYNTNGTTTQYPGYGWTPTPKYPDYGGGATYYPGQAMTQGGGFRMSPEDWQQFDQNIQ